MIYMNKPYNLKLTGIDSHIINIRTSWTQILEQRSRGVKYVDYLVETPLMPLSTIEQESKNWAKK